MSFGAARETPAPVSASDVLRVMRENDRLRAEVEDLRALLRYEAFAPPREWKLTASEERVLAVLLERQLASRVAIYAALYPGRFLDPRGNQILDALLCRLRKKIKPFAARIETLRSRGWSLDEPTRAALAQRNAERKS